MSEAELAAPFTFTPLEPAQREKIGQLREAGYQLARLANELLPDGDRKVAGLHQLHRAVMELNCAIAIAPPRQT
jgi:hypothetical protein